VDPEREFVVRELDASSHRGSEGERINRKI
jgi:hypothetical protein